MTDELMIAIINRIMIGNEDESRALLAEIKSTDLTHIRSCLRGTIQRVEREMMIRV
jgi:hypothetical protein